MNPLIQLKTTPPILIILTLLWFTLLRQVQATPDPGSVDPFNTADGDHALFSNTTGFANAAFGWYALFANTEGLYNTAVGAGALDLNNGNENTAVGTAALLLNTTGTENTAVGTAALELNETGAANTAVGSFALFNSTAVDNTAIGDRTLFNNTTGDQNTAVGTSAFGGGPALFSNTTGRFNTAVGGGALSSNMIGNDNTAAGAGALNDNVDGNENAAVGLNALVRNTGSNNVALGSNAGSQATSGSDNVYIGYNIQGTAGESNSCYIKSIFSQTAPGGSAVFIDANSKLGTLTSSKRFKEDIKPVGKASEALFALKPVTFRYKKEIDPAGTAQLGLVAEDVERVNPDLIVRDKEGKPYSVRYQQVNAMLLNEFLKEHRKVQEQEATITQLKEDFRATVTQLTTRLDEQAAQIQKVSAQLEMSKAAPQTALNDQ